MEHDVDYLNKCFNKIGFPLNIPPKDLLFLISTDGVLVMQKNCNKGEVKPHGFISSLEFADKFKESNKWSTGLLAPNTVYAEQYPHKSQTYNINVIQLPPSYLTFKYIDKRQAKYVTNTYRVFLPYVVSVVCSTQVDGKLILSPGWDGFRIFARNEPLSSLEDNVYSLPLPNIYLDGKVCWGHTKSLQEIPNESPSNHANRVTKYFLSTTYTDHLDPTRPYQFLESYNRYTWFSFWEEISKTDPNQILTWQFYKTGKIKDIISQLKGSIR